VSDINAVEVDSQSKEVLDPKRPIREADITRESRDGSFGPGRDIRCSDAPRTQVQSHFHTILIALGSLTRCEGQEMRRREFIWGLGFTFALRDAFKPLSARAQPTERVRRIGVLKDGP
jgi:hypothetical protein